MTRGPRLPAALIALLLAGVGAVAPASAQQTPPASPPTSTPPTSTPPTSTPPSPAPSSSQAATPAPATTEPARGVAVDASGGPSDLLSRVRAAIEAWSRAAPKLTNLRVDPAASSTIGYATPALLGPDTLSLDLRVPGRAGVEVRLAGAAAHDHPMVLLHETGVLLGLPEGGTGVMAFAVPAKDEPSAPTAADVTALQAQRSFAPEDLNHDGSVDFYDLVLFGQAFGQQGVNLPADFNGDGRVDRKDLALLERAYTFSPPSKTAPGSAPAEAAPAGGSAPAESAPAQPTTPGQPGGGSGSGGTPGSGSSP